MHVEHGVCTRWIAIILAFSCAAGVLGSEGTALADEPSDKTAPPKPAAPSLVPPKPVTALQAEYPKELAKDPKALPADVVLEITVASDGTVKDAKVWKGEAPFSNAALKAAPEWRFEPARRDGQPVGARIRVLIHFTPPVMEPAPEETASGGSAAPNTSGGASRTPHSAPAAQTPIEVIALGERRPLGIASLGRAEVRVLPGAFGDPFRALESLPGVTPIFSGLPFFYIRGAPPGNVGYFLDNIRVPYLYHLALGPSVVNPAIVDRVDLYPGGYPAQFGRFAGGIVSGETTAPQDHLHGEGNIRLFDAGALVEAPLGSKGTALAGGRFSYTGALLSLLAPDASLGYWDYQLRASYDLSPTQHLSLFSFGAYDHLGQVEDGEEQTLFGVEFHRLDLRYDAEVGPRTKIRQAITLGLDRSAFGGGEGIFVQDLMLGARTRVLHRLNDALLLRGGVDATMDGYSIDVGDDDPDTQAFFDILFPPRQDIAVGFYADAVIDAGRKVEFTPGARVDLWGSRGVTDMSADLRLAMGVPVARKVRLSSALGLAHQAPAFVLPVPGFAIGELSGGLQQSVQTSTGLEADLPLGFKASATFFLNGFFNMNDVLGTSSGDDEGPNDGQNGMGGMGGMGNGGMGDGPGPGDGGGPGADGAAVLNQRALGSAVGMELYIRRKLTEKLGGYLAYTLSRSTRSFGTTSNVAAFDRTHVLNGAVSWEPGKGWRLGSRFVFYTGLPTGKDAPDVCIQQRLAPFFRIDGRVEKRWKISKRGWISLVIEMLNASLSKEQSGWGVGEDGECKAQEIGPITVPSIGVEGGLF